MIPAIQDTLLQLFEHVHNDPDSLPSVPIDEWNEGSTERQLLTSFSSMMEKVHEREEQYRNIFEASFDGINISTLDGRIVEANPALCRMFGYTREELLSISSTALIHPDSHHIESEVLQEVGAGHESLRRATCLSKDGTSFMIEAHVTPFIYKGQPHLLSVIRDISEWVEAEQQLREKEEQYRSVFEATNDAVCIMDPEDGHIVEANPAACNMYGYSYEEFIGLPPSAVIQSDQLPTFREEAFPLIRTGGKRQIQGVNLRKDGSEFPIDLHQTVFTYQGEPHILSVMRDITEQVQAQQLLEHRVEERTRELSTLLEVSHNVASTLELKPLLNLILNQIKDVVEYTAATILIRDGSELAIVDYLGPAKREAVLQIRYSVRSTGVDDIVLRQGEPVIIDDVRASTPLAQDYREAVGDMLQIFSSYQRALIVVPLKLKDRVIGMLSLASSEVGCYTPHHASLIVAIANQAAIAIENARLYEQAQVLASIEERQRLARELHDSVSQALYGISLGVHTARMQLDRDAKELAESLDYVLELSEAALIEMRALIFELRPESLETEGLVSALTKQAAALQARQNITVNTDLCAEPDLPLNVKQDLYRVTQEALHNTIKHAHASKIVLRLQQTSEAVTLDVCDDGRGFDVTASFPGHLGLHSMQERVTGFGGEFQIESTPGQGTCIRVQVPDREAL
jgi:PAS domain S-box-containing protein